MTVAVTVTVAVTAGRLTLTMPMGTPGVWEGGVPFPGFREMADAGRLAVTVTVGPQPAFYP